MTSRSSSPTERPRVQFPEANSTRVIPNREHIAAVAVKASLEDTSDEASQEHALAALEKFMGTFRHINATPIKAPLLAIDNVWDADDDEREAALRTIQRSLTKASAAFTSQEATATPQEVTELRSMLCFCETLIGFTQDLLKPDEPSAAADHFQAPARADGPLKSSLKPPKPESAPLPSTLRKFQTTDRSVQKSEQLGDIPAMRALMSLPVHGNELTHLQNALEGLAELIHNHDHLSREGQDWQENAMDRIANPCIGLGVQKPELQAILVQFSATIEDLFKRCVDHHTHHPLNQESTVEYFKSEANEALRDLQRQIDLTQHVD